MKPTSKQIKYLKGQAHSQKPIVTVGIKGLTNSVLEEIDAALHYHELIKVKLPAGSKEAKLNITNQITTANKAINIALTGRILILFRQNSTDETKFSLPTS